MVRRFAAWRRRGFALTLSRMTTSPTSGQRPRTCRACGRKFDYPVKGSAATRHHCEDCVAVPAATRKTLERLNSRVTQLENQLRRLSEKPAAL
jgi:hypothetical protein